MPLGILSDEEFEKELESLNNKVAYDKVIDDLVEVKPDKLVIENNKLVIDNDKVSIDNDKVSSVNCAVLELPTSGRNLGDDNKPETLRKIIAECKINGDDDKSIIDNFKTSSSSISAYSRGMNGTNDKVNDSLARFVKNARNSITRKASRTLIKTLDFISDDKINELKANEMSILAKNMSSIIADMEDKTRAVNNGIRAQFVIFAPPQKQLETYEVIEVSS